MSNAPFIVKESPSYEEYIEHQKSKLDKGISWLPSYEKMYYKLLKGLLINSGITIRDKTSLCIGARTGTEVQVFNDMGSFSVGIDLNPGKDNKFVVFGDASEIQYDDQLVDIVYTNSFDHFLKIKKTIEEIKRVLKPNGYFVLMMTSPADSKKDSFGYVRWESVSDVVAYLEKIYDFVQVQRVDVSACGCFSDFMVLKNV